MSARQPLSALVKIAELGHAPSRRQPPDPVTATELRRLLSRPLAPIADLDREERRRLAEGLTSLAAAFAEVRPSWMGDYAAAAAVALPSREPRLREFMLRELFQSHADAAQALPVLARHLEKQPANQRGKILTVLLHGIARLSDIAKPGSAEALERGFMALASAVKAPASPAAFAKLALDVAKAAAALSPHAFEAPADAKASPLDALRAVLSEAPRAFLTRPRWATFAPEINGLLWQELWRTWRKAAPAPASGRAVPELSHKALLKEGAWSEADQAIARALQDAGRLTRSLEKLDTGGDLGARVTTARGASNLVLQWVRQAARLRNMECQGAFGHLTAFDPVFHESHDAAPGERVRILKPTVVRSNGTQEAVVLRGEVELE